MRRVGGGAAESAGLVLADEAFQGGCPIWCATPELCPPEKLSRVSHTAGPSRISCDSHAPVPSLRSIRPAVPPAPIDPASGSRTGGALRRLGDPASGSRTGGALRRLGERASGSRSGGPAVRCGGWG